MDIVITDSTGRLLDARVEAVGSELVVHSRSGRSRNIDYRPAVEAILSKLDAVGIGYTIYLDSKPAQALPLNHRQLTIPTQTPPEDRFSVLVKAMNAGSASNGAYRRLRFATSATQNELLEALSAPKGETLIENDLGSENGFFALESDAAATAQAFRQWMSILMEQSRATDDHHIFLNSEIGFRQLRSITDHELRIEFWVGDSSASAVQINEPSVPGSENPLGGLARSSAGKRFIVRQGVLHKNSVSPRITASEFAQRTKLAPVKMMVGTASASRHWHIVTPLDDVSNEVIARDTQKFVALCWKARTRKMPAQGRIERLPNSELRKVKSKHIDKAIARLLRGEDAPNFADSRDYDVLAPNNARLAPKKVFGLAIEQALGIQAFPGHFTAGHGNPCFTIIEAAGYPIIAKTEPTPVDQEPVDPDLAGAEGNIKLVKHLKRERRPALAAAKRRAMIADLGHLVCERCDIAPSKSLGPHGDAVIEVHHARVQVSDMSVGHVTRLADLQCLCANCHRIVHRELAGAG